MLIDVILKYMMLSPYSGSAERAGNSIVFTASERNDHLKNNFSEGTTAVVRRKDTVKVASSKMVCSLESKLDCEKKLDVKAESGAKSKHSDDDSDDEEIGNVIKSNKKLTDSPNGTYSFQEGMFIAEQFYNMPSLDYAKLWYAETSRPSRFGQEKEYAEEFAAKDTAVSDTEALSAEEAKETLVKIQYANLLGAKYDVSLETMRDFDTWIKFNGVFFKLFETLYSLTREINYSVGF